MSDRSRFWQTCSNLGKGRCIQCGNLYCDQHGGMHAGYGPYCQACYSSIVQGVLITSKCARQLNKALDILDRSPSTALSPEQLYYKAVGLAVMGKLDEAVDYFEELATTNGREAPPLTQQALGKTLSARAAQYLHNKKVADAVGDLRRAAVLLDDNINQQATLSGLVHQAAAAFFKEGRLLEAIREWEATQVNDWQDVQVAHYLGICYYQLASIMESEEPANADTYWQKAIANWVVVLCHDTYLTTWAKSRTEAVGNVNHNTLEEVRQRMKDRLRNDFRDFRTSYLEQQLPHAQRHLNLEVDFVRELRTAEEMAKTIQQHHSYGSVLRAVCGPLMLVEWRQDSRLDETLKALEKLSPTLQQYLSPIGHVYTLVKDMRRYDEALPILRTWYQQHRLDRAGKTLLLEVLIEKGSLLLSSKKYLEAVIVFEEAVQLNEDQSMARSLLSEAAAKQAREWLEQDDTVQKAIDLIERIRKNHQTNTAEVKAQLAQAYFRRALMYNRKNNHAASLTDLRKCLEIDPNNQMALQNFVIVVQNRAAELSTAKKFDDAINLMNEAIALNPGQVNRELLANIIFERGVFRGNTAVGMVNASPNNIAIRKNLARPMLQQAVVDVETAIQLAPNNAHFKQQLTIIRNLLYQLK